MSNLTTPKGPDMTATPQHLQYLRTRCRAYPALLPSGFRRRVRTVFPYIFVPDWFFVNQWDTYWDAVLEHEWEHLEQQSGAHTWVPVVLRLGAFLAKYLFSKPYRLKVEAQGIAAEIMVAPLTLRQWLFDSYKVDLTTADYGRTAPSVDAAAAAILEALRAYGSDWKPAGCA